MLAAMVTPRLGGGRSRVGGYKGQLLTNGCGHLGTTLDAEMAEQVIWPDQADGGGLTWTRTFS